MAPQDPQLAHPEETTTTPNGGLKERSTNGHLSNGNSKVNGVTILGSDNKPIISRAEAEKLGEGDTWNYWEHIIWINVFWFTLLHIGSIYALTLTFETKILTWIWAVLLYKTSLFSITAGVHRLWSHRSYKAALPWRIFLAIINGIAYQNSVYEWARDHRVHHKYTETNADPVNSKRGFFFSHVGWLLTKKHPDVRRIGGKVDMSDILNDPVIYYQRKYYAPLTLVMCFIIPTVVPWYYWGESLWNAYFIAMVLRYTLALNATWLVNSAAHMYGARPYDKTIAPAENLTVSALTLGEGYHNFHHTFPWDYSTSEWGYRINLTKLILDMCAKVGLAYDLKQVSPEMLKKRIERTGPGSSLAAHEYSDHGYMLHSEALEK